jgi:hypothetical protein
MQTHVLTLHRNLGELGDGIAVEFLVRFCAGAPESGAAGRPEDYDPGLADTVSVVSAMANIDQKTIDLTAFFRRELPDTLHDDLCAACAGIERALRDEHRSRFHFPFNERMCA